MYFKITSFGKPNTIVPNYMIQLKTILTVLLLSVTFWSTGQVSEKDSCSRIIGKGEYHLADYASIGWTKEMQDTLAPLENHFKRCFCDNQDKIFLKSLKVKQEAIVEIEPEIINLKSCDGLYAFRVFFKKAKFTPHYFNGIWHEVFLISNNRIYYLNDLYRNDSLAVDRLIDVLTPELLKSFDIEDIEFFRKFGNRSVYWSDDSIEVPLIIYSDKGIVHFDNRRKE